MSSKILTLEHLSQTTQLLKRQQRKIALCHGCFDLLHIGHLRHMKAAKALADVLLVTVTPDRFIKKGPGRPVFSEDLRVEMISALEIVNYVAINHWPSAVETLKLLQPHYFVKGSDYKQRSGEINPNIYEEKQVCLAYNIDLVYTEELSFSSTALLRTYTHQQEAHQTDR